MCCFLKGCNSLTPPRQIQLCFSSLLSVECHAWRWTTNIIVSLCVCIVFGVPVRLHAVKLFLIIMIVFVSNLERRSANILSKLKSKLVTREEIVTAMCMRRERLYPVFAFFSSSLSSVFCTYYRWSETIAIWRCLCIVFSKKEPSYFFYIFNKGISLFAIFWQKSSLVIVKLYSPSNGRHERRNLTKLN